MSRHEQIPAPFPDDFGIGQEKVARIRMDVSMKCMGEVVYDAFTPCYRDPEWRAMSRRIFYENRAEYDRAKEILEAINAG